MTLRPHESKMPGEALIIGCGYRGRRVASAWCDQGRTIYVLTRSRAEELQRAGLSPIVGDVTEPASLKALPRVETVLYAVGRDRSAGHSMRDVFVDGLR